ncbi:MAG: hypothetical protein A2Y33_02730 [Spirochaetes bacterium GWF1_51_8]|nr:MAG: hypothetical protein A2Y33_02730 [Spirochaetes bacterium GWF1_51_8]
MFSVENVGPIRKAEVEFGDFTVIVGQQATGKSIFLQLYKLVQDSGVIKKVLKDFGYSFQEWKDFLSIYFGEGMESVWKQNSSVIYKNKAFDENSFKNSREGFQKNFYIPAQRVIAMENGWLKPFTTFESSYPYVMREFSEDIRFEMEQPGSSTIFPINNRINKDLRSVIDKNIFYSSSLLIDKIGNRKTVILKISEDTRISIGSWSTGQREFTPLLLGLFHLLPPSKVTQKDRIETVIIEEPEAGLHPAAIIDVILLLMELLKRGYQVILSTHSPTVLDIIWAINEIKKHKTPPQTFLNLFNVSKTQFLIDLASKCINKTFKVFYFHHEDSLTDVFDISDLDPGSEDDKISGWGGLSSFSGRIADVVGSLYQDEE